MTFCPNKQINKQTTKTNRQTKTKSENQLKCVQTSANIISRAEAHVRTGECGNDIHQKKLVYFNINISFCNKTFFLQYFYEVFFSSSFPVTNIVPLVTQYSCKLIWKIGNHHTVKLSSNEHACYKISPIKKWLSSHFVLGKKLFI